MRRSARRPTARALRRKIKKEIVDCCEGVRATESGESHRGGTLPEAGRVSYAAESVPPGATERVVATQGSEGRSGVATSSTSTGPHHPWRTELCSNTEKPRTIDHRTCSVQIPVAY